MDKFENFTSEENNQENEPQSAVQKYGTNEEGKVYGKVYDDGDFTKQEAPSQESQTSQSNMSVPEPQNGKRKKDKKPKMWLVYILVLILAVGGSFGGTYLANSYLNANSIKSGTVVLYQSAITTEADPSEATYASVSQSVANSVVEIYTEQVESSMFGQYVTEGAGSGVIISEDGYIITNHHVIDGAVSVYVRLTNGEEYSAVIIGKDADHDIAVIKITKSGLQPAVFADSDKLIVGEEVIAVGNPLGELGGSVTNGIISALDRKIQIDDVTMNLLQTNTAINPGNSGGGLFNMKGELVGVVNAKNGGEKIDNIGFAIPSNDALKVATDLMESGYVTGKPAIGISVYEFTSLSEAKQYGFNMTGVYIVESTNSTELEYGDLILAVEDEEISQSADIASALSGKEVGEKVTVTILRGRATHEVEVTLVELAN